MRYASRLLPMCLVTLVTLTACGDESTLLTVDTSGPGVEEPGPVPPTMNPQSMEVEGYPTVGELRSGFIYDRAGQPLEITYEIHEGLAIWQGDIIIGTPDRIATSVAELTFSAPGPLRGVVINGAGFRWPGGVIPYVITDATTSIVLAAIQRIEDQTPGVTLRPFVGGDANWVTFQNAAGCSSAIGMQGGNQNINLKVNDGTSLCSIGNAAHEIGHALGMYHEHTRCDRGGFVTIDYAEVTPGKEGNFWQAGAADAVSACSGVTDLFAYDYGSMMHYGAFAFAIGTNPTITATQAGGGAMGQRSVVGPTDVATIDNLYGANNLAPVPVIGTLAGPYPEGTAVPFDASGSTDADDDEAILTYAWVFDDGTCPASFTCTDDDPDHAYADDDVYSWQVTVSDGFDDGVTGDDITITNVDPSVSVGADAVIDEGDTFARAGSFTDPGADTWTATVDYDDGPGAVDLTLTGKTFSLSNTYVDNRVTPYNVEVVVTDDDGGVGSDDADVTVNNVAPTVDAGDDATIDSGETYDFSGTFSDPGIEDDPWLWVIDWGFGDDTDGSTDDQSAAIEASRQVCVAGDYIVSLTVTDKDGGVGMDELTLTVPYIPIDIDIMPGTDRNPVSLKKGGAVPVAILGSVDLDVADIDASSLTLGDESDPDTPIGQKINGTYEAYMEDVNDDGMMDLVTIFPRTDLVGDGDLTELSTDLVLRGFLIDACTNIRGSDNVTVLN